MKSYRLALAGIVAGTMVVSTGFAQGNKKVDKTQIRSFAGNIGPSAPPANPTPAKQTQVNPNPGGGFGGTPRPQVKNFAGSIGPSPIVNQGGPSGPSFPSGPSVQKQQVRSFVGPIGPSAPPPSPRPQVGQIVNQTRPQVKSFVGPIGPSTPPQPRSLSNGPFVASKPIQQQRSFAGSVGPATIPVNVQEPSGQFEPGQSAPVGPEVQGSVGVQTIPGQRAVRQFKGFTHVKSNIYYHPNIGYCKIVYVPKTQAHTYVPQPEYGSYEPASYGYGSYEPASYGYESSYGHASYGYGGGCGGH